MNRVRVSCGLLAAGMATVALSCAPATDHAGGELPVAAVTSERPSETLTPILEQAIPNIRGKTFTSAIVHFPPDARAVPHRHGEAFVYAYVLDGTMRSQLDDEPARTYHQGEQWVEEPGTYHALTENTSKTESAKLLVVFISNTGDELKVPWS
ncbi:cupin domain-containing protein [Streptomyces chromofuscus]|uniref:cupin domain-containing protein n=1 Tax=Streptomyces chromofuscus TaxID=42881 RepID=UPI0016789323|nr:cupin domain-containing protein [Streptomyces chromofuscus]GGT38096.1 cupin [Streptomyces chromofuscus]